jgi:glutaredoxin 3
MKGAFDMKLELFVMRSCPFCRRVQKAIGQMGRSDITVYDVTEDPAANERLIREGGQDQVPCLMIDGKPMYESRDIIEWLESHPEE